MLCRALYLAALVALATGCATPPPEDPAPDEPQLQVTVGAESPLEAQQRALDAQRDRRPPPPQEPDMSDADYQYVLGCQAVAEKRYTEAVACFERVLSVQPLHLGAQHDLAVSYYLLGRLEEAEGRLTRLLELLSNPPREARFRARIHFNLALVLGKQERWAEAVEHLEHILEIDPSLQEPKDLLEEWKPKAAEVAEAG